MRGALRVGLRAWFGRSRARVRASTLALSAVGGLLSSACESKPHAGSTPPAQATHEATPHAPGSPAPGAIPADPALLAPASGGSRAEPPASTQSAPHPERRFGAAPQVPGDPLPVAALLASPEPHLGKTIKCEGKVARVCQAAGCWLELQAETGGEGLRVPMAAHAFFIPQDAVGQLAVIEGELERHELPAAQKQHYAGEGMQAMGPLSLEATSVVLR